MTCGERLWSKTARNKPNPNQPNQRELEFSPLSTPDSLWAPSSCWNSNETVISSREDENACSSKIHFNFKVGHLKHLLSTTLPVKSCCYQRLCLRLPEWLLASERVPIFTFWDSEVVAPTPRHKPDLPQLQDGWFTIAYGPLTELLSPAWLAGGWPAGSVFKDYPLNLGGKCLWFSPNHSKANFSGRRQMECPFRGPAQPVTSEELLLELLLSHWRYPGMFDRLSACCLATPAALIMRLRNSSYCPLSFSRRSWLVWNPGLCTQTDRCQFPVNCGIACPKWF